MKNIFTLLLLFIIFHYRTTAQGIVVDSSYSTPSTCQNDGSATVYAHTPHPPMTFEIHSGPVTRPAQVSGYFPSLPPGVYTIYMYDAAGFWEGVQETVPGTYAIPDFHPYVLYPLCRRSSDYLLVAGIDSGTGQGPFHWQLVAPSPVTSASQSSDSFHVHLPGTYSIQCTDACGDIQTRQFTFAGQGASNMDLTNTGPSPYLLGCDSVFIKIDYLLYSDSSSLVFPLTMTVTDNVTGAYSQYIQDTLLVTANFYNRTQEYITSYSDNNGTGIINVGTTIPAAPGQQYTVLIADGCGDSSTFVETIPQPFLTPSGFYSYPSGACGYANSTGYEYSMPTPNRWQFTDNTTNTIVDTGSDNNLYGANLGIGLMGYHPGDQYTLIALDQCGDTLYNSFIWPQPVNPQAVFNAAIAPVGWYSCLDSTATLAISISGYGMGVLSILSGPASAHSSKSGYAYRDTIIYPQHYPMAVSSANLFLADMPAGVYQYEFRDSCGDDLTASITISEANLSILGHQASYVRGCIDANKIVIDHAHPANTYIQIRDLATGLGIYNTQTQNSNDTIYNIPSGSYVITSYYESNARYLQDTVICPVIYDTITIPPYENPQISGFASRACSPSLYLTCLADSATGVAPYSYSIVAGPDTFVTQASSTFTLMKPGTYSVRLIDICGNSGVKDITIDSIPVPDSRYLRVDNCYQVSIGGEVYVSDTILKHTIQNQSGCDSLLIVDSIFVRGLHSFDIFPKPIDTFCSNRTNILATDLPYSSYHWYYGSTAAIHTVLYTGDYSLTVTDSSGCAASSTIRVLMLDSVYLESGWLGDTAVCALAPLYIDLAISHTSFANYSWDNSPVQYGLHRTISDSGTYLFTISNYCGSTTYSMYIRDMECMADIYIPTAFTPNGDGANDIFQVYTSFEVVDFDLRIWDRWGEKVYETNDVKSGWDGSYRMNKEAAGIYIYTSDMKTLAGTALHRQGTFTLIR